MIKHPALAVFLTALLITGCTTASSVSVSNFPTPVSETLPKAPANISYKATSWRIIPTSETQSYSSLSTTSITQVDPLVPPRHDSLTIQILYSISISRRPDSVLLSGSVADFRLEGPAGEPGNPKLVLPISFNGNITNQNLKLETAGTTQITTAIVCDEVSQTPLKIIQRNVVTLPLEMTSGQTWTDSISSVICSGTFPLNLISIRAFRAVSEAQLEGVQILLIDQTERTFSKGEGSQGQHRIFIETQGIISRRLSVDRLSGALINSKATSTTSLSVQVSGKIQHFTELSTEVTQRTK